MGIAYVVRKSLPDLGVFTRVALSMTVCPGYVRAL